MTSREKVLSAHPAAYQSAKGTVWSQRGLEGRIRLGKNWDDAASKLPPGSPAVNYLSGHDDPTLTETCPVCGASRKPGDKCLSCGQQSSPAGGTASKNRHSSPETLAKMERITRRVEAGPRAVPEPVPTEVCEEPE